ncbi:MAG: DMT family transporter [Firmicutes bacterium]|nr:DMT family transporter [Bacillota bacterium]
MDKLIYILFVVLGGAAAALQAPINSGLGKRIGVFEGGLWSFTTGALFLLLIVLLFGKGNFAAITSVPKWQLFGGVLGVIAVTAMIVCAPQLGVGLATVCLLFGQIVLVIVIDSLGLFGVQKVPLDYNRILGVIFMLLGVFFVYRSKFGV